MSYSVYVYSVFTIFSVGFESILMWLFVARWRGGSISPKGYKQPPSKQLSDSTWTSLGLGLSPGLGPRIGLGSPAPVGIGSWDVDRQPVSGVGSRTRVWNVRPSTGAWSKDQPVSRVRGGRLIARVLIRGEHAKSVSLEVHMYAQSGADYMRYCVVYMTVYISDS